MEEAFAVMARKAAAVAPRGASLGALKEILRREVERLGSPEASGELACLVLVQIAAIAMRYAVDHLLPALGPGEVARMVYERPAEASPARRKTSCQHENILRHPAYGTRCEACLLPMRLTEGGWVEAGAGEPRMESGRSCTGR